MEPLAPLDLDLRTRVVYAPGAFARLGALAAPLGGRALLVTDKGVAAAGYAGRAAANLEAAGISTRVFDSAPENPTELDVAAAAAVARDFDADLLIGLGGGSAIDCAKGANFILSNGGRIQDYWGAEKAPKPMLPVIAVPTTAGTGSEVQRYALISDSVTHAKMACGDSKAAPRIALLDPGLTLTLPRLVTAVSGIDAISHAVESYVTRSRNPDSIGFAMRAWRLLAPNYEKVLADPSDLQARGAMLLGACFAGLAIERSMLGAAHSCANPLTANHATVHGVAVALMLPPVIRFNGPVAGEWYAELLAVLDRPPAASIPPSEALAREIERLRAVAGLPASLSGAGIASPDFNLLSGQAAGQWTARFNPREIARSDFECLFRSVGE